MPRREDLRSVLVIGSGPIVIGQACEFDYSGTQACRVLRAEGIRVSLVNSNPATIMTDPEFADATYVEPITADVLEKVIAAERPDAVLPTLGGQTALNAAVAPAQRRHARQVRGGAHRRQHRGDHGRGGPAAVQGHRHRPRGGGPRSRACHTLGECEAAARELGYPLVVRPSFTLGGAGSGVAHDEQDLRRIAGAGLDASPVTEVLLEESILGWKEFELELMRDRHDNVVVVCPIENIDPMGVHTGDSVTVAPAMTLTDREYQHMRDVAIAVIRRGRGGHRRLQHPVRGAPADRPDGRDRDEPAGVPVVGAGLQGHRLPDRQDRRPAGHRLHPRRDPQRHHRETPASFEPALDYVVVKVPRFAFEKFPAPTRCSPRT